LFFPAAPGFLKNCPAHDIIKTGCNIWQGGIRERPCKKAEGQYAL